VHEHERLPGLNYLGIAHGRAAQKRLGLRPKAETVVNPAPDLAYRAMGDPHPIMIRA
jgi:hypothetical protein